MAPKPALGEQPLWHRFVAGAFAEMFAVSFTHPMDVLKVRLQLTGECNPSKRALTARDFKEAAQRLILQEGVQNGLYGGISASWTRQFFFSGMRHGGYGVLERKWREKFGSINLGQRLLCAVTSGSVAATLANPTDVVLIRMQSDGHWPPEARRGYRHVFHGLSCIIRDEGIRRLWRGCSPTVLRAALVTMSQIGTYEEVKSRALAAGFQDGLPLHLGCAISSATVACLVTSPVDVVKTRIMNMQQKHGISYNGPVDVVMQTARTEGIRAFYKGISATFLRLWPHTVLLWLGQERIGAYLRQM